MAGKYNFKKWYHISRHIDDEIRVAIRFFFVFYFSDDDMESFVVLGSSPPSDSDSFNSFSLASNRAEQNPRNSLNFCPASLKSDGNSLMRSALYEPVTEPKSSSSLKNENGTSSLIDGAKSLVPVASGTQNNLNSMTLSKIEFKNDETSMVSSFAADIILGKMGPKSVQVNFC